METNAPTNGILITLCFINTDLPFRINMAHVFLSCSFYLALVVALAVCALFIRLIGATPDPEPDQRKRTKRNKLVSAAPFSTFTKRSSVPLPCKVTKFQPSNLLTSSVYQILISPNPLKAYRHAFQWLHYVISTRP